MWYGSPDNLPKAVKQSGNKLIKSTFVKSVAWLLASDCVLLPTDLSALLPWVCLLIVYMSDL